MWIPVSVIQLSNERDGPPLFHKLFLRWPATCIVAQRRNLSFPCNNAEARQRNGIFSSTGFPTDTLLLKPPSYPLSGLTPTSWRRRATIFTGDCIVDETTSGGEKEENFISSHGREDEGKKERKRNSSFAKEP